MVRSAIQFVAWFVGSAVVMSFLEHQVHRSLMHKKNVFSRRLRSFNKMFEHHAILHHRHYSKVFNDEPAMLPDALPSPADVTNSASVSCLFASPS
jgi:hypothetical protein